MLERVTQNEREPPVRLVTRLPRRPRSFDFIRRSVVAGVSLRSRDGKDAECADTEREEHDRHDGEKRPGTTARMLPH